MGNRSLLLGIMFITALHAFDEMVLVISMPKISQALGSGDWYGLTIASYILAAIVGMSWAGQKIDSRGPRYVLCIGLIMFLIGLVMAIFAWDTFSFIIARIFQGIGGGIGWTTAFALVNLSYDEKNRGLAISAMDFAWVIPSLLAPALGGLFIDFLSWRWIFVVQLLPLALVAVLVLPRTGHLAKKVHKKQWRAVADALCIAVGTGLMLYAVSQPLGWHTLLFVVGIAMGGPAFNRVMPKSWWRGASYLSLPVLIAMLSFIAFYGMEAYQPLYLVDFKGFSTTAAGLLLTSASVSWMVGSFYAGRSQPRFSPTQFMWLGSALILLGIALLSASSLWVFNTLGIYASWSVAGLGMGLSFNSARTMAMANTPKNKEGSVATAMTLAANMGIGLASGLGGAFKNQVEIAGGGLPEVLLAVAIFSLLVAIFSFGLLVLRNRKGYVLARSEGF